MPEKENNATISQEADPLRTTEEVAERYRVTPNTVSIWRFKGVGPAYLKLSRRCVRYRESALCAYDQTCEVN